MRNHLAPIQLHFADLNYFFDRMAASRAKLLAHRKKKKLAAPSTVKLLQPMASLSVEDSQEKIVQKVRVPTRKSALVPSEGRSMGMEID